MTLAGYDSWKQREPTPEHNERPLADLRSEQQHLEAVLAVETDAGARALLRYYLVRCEDAIGRQSCR